MFVYRSDGSLIGNWEFEDVDKPEGITVHGEDLWIVDRGEDKVLYFRGGAARRSGKTAPTSGFPLLRANRNPQGISDPPAIR